MTSDPLVTSRLLQESAPKKSLAAKSAIEEDLSSEDLSALRSAIETLSKEKGQTYIGEHEVSHLLWSWPWPCYLSAMAIIYILPIF